MSGWFALLGPKSPSEPAVECALAESFRFRGPDGTTFLRTDNATMCAARLKLQRRNSDDVLPVFSDGFAMVGDIRLDNRNALVQELQSFDAEVTHDTPDAALVLAAYRKWSHRCVDHLFGDFGFVVWHQQSGSGFVARDRMGVKPVYYASLPGGYLFCNTFQTLRSHREVSGKLDEHAVADFLMFGENWHPERTFYADIRRVPAAHCGTFISGEFDPLRYWVLEPPAPLKYQRNEDVVEQFSSVLKEAVRDRIPDERVGVLMSGGLDSPLLAAMAKDVSQERGAGAEVRAYSAFHSHLIVDDERQYAECAAEHLRIPIQFVEVDKDVQPYEGWAAGGLPLPEPVDNPIEIMRHRLYAAAANDVRVAVMGFDGDALLFLDYGGHFRRKLKRFDFAGWWSDAAWYMNETGALPPIGLRTSLQRAKERVTFPKWINADFARRLGLKERWDTVQKGPKLPDVERKDSYRAMTVPAWSAVLDTLDASFTGLPLDIVQPFLDLRVISLVLALPPFPWCIRKKLIREACYGILPEQLVRRPKTTLSGDPVRSVFVEHAEQDFRADLQQVREFVDLRHGLSFAQEIRATAWNARQLLRPVTLAKWIKKSGASING